MKITFFSKFKLKKTFLLLIVLIAINFWPVYQLNWAHCVVAPRGAINSVNQRWKLEICDLYCLFCRGKQVLSRLSFLNDKLHYKPEREVLRLKSSQGLRACWRSDELIFAYRQAEVADYVNHYPPIYRYRNDFPTFWIRLAKNHVPSPDERCLAIRP